MLEAYHLTRTELEAGLEYIRQSPKGEGLVRMIARRPAIDEREEQMEAQLDPQEGLVGDTWKVRPSKHTADGGPLLDAQLTIMNARCIELIAQGQERWALAGDQLYVDFDLSNDNIPPGTRLVIGSAVIEVMAKPHTGCQKFSARFGVEALKFVNSPEGKRLHLRGINTRIVQAGTVRVGDKIRKLHVTE
jgi:MOSC domain-containing protein YiiM